MCAEPLDRTRIRFRPLNERKSKARIEEIAADPDAPPPDPGRAAQALDLLAERVIAARRRGAGVILCHGAHLIRNGMGPVVIRLLEEGWVTHLATNGAGSIHDWEFSFGGASTEDVRQNVAVGEFGIWEETGRWLGLAVGVGACEGLGYGAAVGRMILTEGLRIPARTELRAAALEGLGAAGELDARGGLDAPRIRRAAAAADLLATLESRRVDAGELRIPHPWKRFSVQAAAFRLGLPFTVHPGVGQDIIYAHPLLDGGAVGRAAIADFLLFAGSVATLQGGVYLSVGSSVMSPMIFEKSLSMARNLLRQEGRALDDMDIVVNDLAEVAWDWERGEPPAGDPAYFVRFAKTFSRMGGRFAYVGLDNRAFVGGLYARLRKR